MPAPMVLETEIFFKNMTLAAAGRASFTVEQLQGNLAALEDALNKAKPAAAKGVFLKKISVSSTMGAGIRIDQATVA